MKSSLNQTLLRDDVPLSIQNESLISVNTVLNTHQTLLEKGRDTNHKILQLIDAMGGMDTVLNEYLALNKLNAEQLSTINQILLTIMDQDISKDADNIDIDTNQVLHIRRDNTYFNNLFSKERTANIIRV
eukprot:719864_1